MLEICKRHTSTTHGKIRLGVGISVIFIAAMVFGLLIMAKPYAVYATGEKVAEPWVISVDNEEIVVVESKVAGESVVSGVQAAYGMDLVEQQEADLGENVKVEKYIFEEADTHPVVMTAEEALDYILTENKTDQPLMEVPTTEIISGEEAIPFETEEVESDELLKGEKEVETEGVEGTRSFVAELSLINGKEVSRVELSSEVSKKPVTKVVLVGTKEEEEVVEEPATTNNGGGGYTNTTTTATNSGSGYTAPAQSYAPPASGSGSSLAGYATQFVGTPYVWGGNSLSSGVDCSGFTCAVYRAYGVSLPRTSYGQGACGTPVSAANRAPGDLMYYGGHVGIYIGGGQMVHASTYGVGVVVQPVYGYPQYRRLI